MNVALTNAVGGGTIPIQTAIVNTNRSVSSVMDATVNPYAEGLREPGKSKREWNADFIESFQPLNPGDPVRFELTGGVMAEGSLKIVQIADGKVTYVSGELTAPEAGKFFFLTPPVGGKAGSAVGVVEFSASQTAYRIELTGPRGEPELWQRRLDEVLCMAMPKVAEAVLADAAPTNETANIPPVRPDLVPDYVPSYNSNVVSLQSYPGSPAVLLLDFFGGYTPTWGGVTYVRPANVDNVTIRDLWKRVAEDYMPFNINVTTDLKVYLAAPVASRQRCCFTDTPITAAGVAYIGSWNWGNDTPCWSVYTIGKNGAEVGAHEPGHTLGLGHQTQEIPNGTNTTHVEYYGGQGSGATGWAPIMGVGYYQPVTTWSKGEYQYAGNTSDALVTITTANNNVTYRTDDTGSTLATSRYLEVYTNNTAFAEGVIERTDDTDAFQFTTIGGTVTLTANPVGDWSDLAMMATLADAADTMLASNNPQTMLSATITTNLAAGTYTFRVTGAGRNDPLLTGFSSYCSHGYYSISGSVAGARMSTRLSVVEHATNDTVVGAVPAVNTNGSPLAYAIASGNTDGTFSVDNSGMVSVANNVLLDYYRLATNTLYAVQFELFMNITNVNDPAQTELNRRVVIAVQKLYPPVPTALTAAADTGLRIDLAWIGGKEAISYSVKRSTTHGGTYTTVASPNDTSYTDGGLTNGVTYYYVVSAVNTNGESTNSAEASAQAQAVSNFGFENPIIGSGNYSYNPNGGFWVFSGAAGSGSGIVANGSGFSNPNAPEGTQAAFVQSYGSIAQTLSGFTPGTSYTITYSAAQRSGASQHGGESWNIVTDGNVIKPNAPGATSYTTYTATFTASAAIHTLSFMGTDLAGGDNTVFIDNVRFSPGLQPVAASVALTSPANSALFIAPATVSLAAAVTTHGNIINSVQFYADAGTLVGRITNAPYTCDWANVTAGKHSVFARVIFNDTSSADSVPVNLAVINLNTNFGFEIPSLGSGNHAYNPVGAMWVFNGYAGNGAGIVPNGSAFGNPNAPEGTQAAFVQQFGTISQTLSGFVSGTNYTITYSAAQRSGASQNGGESWNVLIDNNVIKINSSGVTSYTTYTANFTATAATHILAFVGTDLAGGDNTVFIDNIRITPPLAPAVTNVAPWLTRDTLPASAATVIGDTITFSAAFSNSPAANYQWQFINSGVATDISGATNPAITLNNLQLTNTGSFRLKAVNKTNSQGVAYSSPSPLTVASVPAAVNNVITSYAAQTGLGSAVTNFTTTWTVTPGSLIAGKSPSSVGSGNFSLFGAGLVAVLTDGTFGRLNYWPNVGGSPTEVTCGTVAGGAGQSVTYTLTGSASGYNLTNIIVYGGWGDAGRDQQAYTVYYSTIAAPTAFILLSSVNYNPANPFAVQSATRATLLPANGVLATNVAAVKFDFTTPAGENDSSGYSEIDLYGTPTPQPVKWAVGNGNWDTSTLNWKSLTSGSSTSYQENNLAAFDDSATGSSPITVTLTGNRSPSILTNNSTKDYTLAGNFNITSSSLVKNGTGTLVLDNSGANNFTRIQINNGSVQVGNNDANGSLGAGSVTNNGVLSFNRTDTVTVSTLISGAGSLVQNGSGTLVVGGANTYAGATIINAGTLAMAEPGSISDSALIIISIGATLDVTGRSDQTLILNSNRTLKGSGSVNGNLFAQSGSVLNPGDTIGTLLVQSNVLLNGLVVMELNRTNGLVSDELLSVAGSITAGGTLTVTNLGSALQAGDTFQLFNQPVSGFATVNLPQVGVNAWANNLADKGTLAVVSTASPTLMTQVAGDLLTLTWPADHTGWRLQVQTNNLAQGLGTNWSEVIGSTITNQLAIPINATDGSVFYRLLFQ